MREIKEAYFLCLVNEESNILIVHLLAKVGCGGGLDSDVLSTVI